MWHSVHTMLVWHVMCASPRVRRGPHYPHYPALTWPGDWLECHLWPRVEIVGSYLDNYHPPRNLEILTSLVTPPWVTGCLTLHTVNIFSRHLRLFAELNDHECHKSWSHTFHQMIMSFSLHSRVYLLFLCICWSELGIKGPLAITEKMKAV